MANTLRTNLIRLASTFPKGSEARSGLLKVLAGDKVDVDLMETKSIHARFDGYDSLGKDIDSAYKHVTKLVGAVSRLEGEAEGASSKTLKSIFESLSKAQKALDAAADQSDKL